MEEHECAMECGNKTTNLEEDDWFIVQQGDAEYHVCSAGCLVDFGMSIL